VSTAVAEAGRPPVGPATRGRRAAGWAAALAVAAVALWQALEGDVEGLAAVPDVLRAALATLVLFGLAGYAPARLLAPRAMLPHLTLLVLPTGAVVSGLALSVLGFLRIPFGVSLALVLAGGA
jgi:hypothetical protein